MSSRITDFSWPSNLADEVRHVFRPMPITDVAAAQQELVDKLCVLADEVIISDRLYRSKVELKHYFVNLLRDNTMIDVDDADAELVEDAWCQVVPSAAAVGLDEDWARLQPEGDKPKPKAKFQQPNLYMSDWSMYVRASLRKHNVPFDAEQWAAKEILAASHIKFETQGRVHHVSEIEKQFLDDFITDMGDHCPPIVPDEIKHFFTFILSHCGSGKTKEAMTAIKTLTGYSTRQDIVMNLAVLIISPFRVYAASQTQFFSKWLGVDFVSYLDSKKGSTRIDAEFLKRPFIVVQASQSLVKISTEWLAAMKNQGRKVIVVADELNVLSKLADSKILKGSIGRETLRAFLMLVNCCTHFIAMEGMPTVLTLEFLKSAISFRQKQYENRLDMSFTHTFCIKNTFKIPMTFNIHPTKGSIMRCAIDSLKDGMNILVSTGYVVTVVNELLLRIKNECPWIAADKICVVVSSKSRTEIVRFCKSHDIPLCMGLIKTRGDDAVLDFHAATEGMRVVIIGPAVSVGASSEHVGHFDRRFVLYQGGMTYDVESMIQSLFRVRWFRCPATEAFLGKNFKNAKGAQQPADFISFDSMMRNAKIADVMGGDGSFLRQFMKDYQSAISVFKVVAEIPTEFKKNGYYQALFKAYADSFGWELNYVPVDADAPKESRIDMNISLPRETHFNFIWPPAHYKSLKAVLEQDSWSREDDNLELMMLTGDCGDDESTDAATMHLRFLGWMLDHIASDRGRRYDPDRALVLAEKVFHELVLDTETDKLHTSGRYEREFARLKKAREVWFLALSGDSSRMVERTASVADQSSASNTVMHIDAYTALMHNFMGVLWKDVMGGATTVDTASPEQLHALVNRRFRGVNFTRLMDSLKSCIALVRNGEVLLGTEEERKRQLKNKRATTDAGIAARIAEELNIHVKIDVSGKKFDMKLLGSLADKDAFAMFLNSTLPPPAIESAPNAVWPRRLSAPHAGNKRNAVYDLARPMQELIIVSDDDDDEEEEESVQVSDRNKESNIDDDVMNDHIKNATNLVSLQNEVLLMRKTIEDGQATQWFQKILITGPSGCGKSTLARTMLNDLGYKLEDIFIYNSFADSETDGEIATRYKTPLRHIDGRPRKSAVILEMVDVSWKWGKEKLDGLYSLLANKRPRSRMPFILIAEDPYKNIKCREFMSSCVNVRLYTPKLKNFRKVLQQAAHAAGISIGELVERNIVDHIYSTIPRRLGMALQDHVRQSLPDAADTLARQAEYIATFEGGVQDHVGRMLRDPTRLQDLEWRKYIARVKDWLLRCPLAEVPNKKALLDSLNGNGISRGETVFHNKVFDESHGNLRLALKDVLFHWQSRTLKPQLQTTIIEREHAPLPPPQQPLPPPRIQEEDDDMPTFKFSGRIAKPRVAMPPPREVQPQPFLSPPPPRQQQTTTTTGYDWALARLNNKNMSTRSVRHPEDKDDFEHGVDLLADSYQTRMPDPKDRNRTPSNPSGVLVETLEDMTKWMDAIGTWDIANKRCWEDDSTIQSNNQLFTRASDAISSRLPWKPGKTGYGLMPKFNTRAPVAEVIETKELLHGATTNRTKQFSLLHQLTISSFSETRGSNMARPIDPLLQRIWDTERASTIDDWTQLDVDVAEQQERERERECNQEPQPVSVDFAM